MRCNLCGGPMLGNEKHCLCPRCRKIAPQSLPMRRTKMSDPWASHVIRFTEDELASDRSTERG